MAALTVASSAIVEATRTMDMVKKTASTSYSTSAASNEAGAAEEQRHQTRHVSHLFFLFRRSPEFALGRAC
jgi:hypothetical protein